MNRHHQRNRQRSIPACAGEPRPGIGRCDRGRVYPRVCGGTTYISSHQHDLRGLSPRVRGNRGHKQGIGGHTGSIPACAGEPCPQPVHVPPQSVYPRVCGGTADELMTDVEGNGLSPRVRGNRLARIPPCSSVGSIPACAGEPGGRPYRLSTPPVYPRVCGGTVQAGRSAIRLRGLSPRVRGNHRSCVAGRVTRGSIPACAGEPIDERRTAIHGGVYPRVCGGTRLLPPRALCTRGLSPRVRGNRPDQCDSVASRRSIPACAGEPMCLMTLHGICEVYPRVCGGTLSSAGPALIVSGLSPRVRGNPQHMSNASRELRSIPACAGEPYCPRNKPRPDPVYPRVCGGTIVDSPQRRPRQGLSPRVRGNHR